ncbi:hypothetical protein XM38_036170 [Halomicronema hongdechloris C2206]|uniref:Uncharacterized protein n=1 Tax=Halomicronema hongdechloris C2206 TaxID=1641165 RepID=A0A1Z3HQR2_9CYAN|nr:hypothetical protein XM38_036170 [Halomicronema hongdechloris C2206]
MEDSRFNPERWDHWLLIVAFLALSGWILWKVYSHR